MVETMNSLKLNFSKDGGQNHGQPSGIPSAGRLIRLDTPRRAAVQGGFVNRGGFNVHAATCRNLSGIVVDGWIVPSFLGRVAGFSMVFSAIAF